MDEKAVQGLVSLQASAAAFRAVAAAEAAAEAAALGNSAASGVEALALGPKAAAESAAGHAFLCDNWDAPQAFVSEGKNAARIAR